VVEDLPDMVGSGQSVGGVISETVGGCDSSVELQRIVERCNCELVFVSYGQDTLDIEHDLEGLFRGLYGIFNGVSIHFLKNQLNCQIDHFGTKMNE